MAFTMNKRYKFYLGLLIFAVALILLAVVLYLGPNNKIDETKLEIIYDRPRGPGFDDVKTGDKLILNFESTKSINVIVLHTKDSGDFFLLEDRDVEHYYLAEESTGGSFEYIFQDDGAWTVYFENPDPPPRTAPVVTYWGELIKKDQDLTNHYLNITFTIILMILGIALLLSARSKQQPKKKGKKNNKKPNK